MEGLVGVMLLAALVAQMRHGRDGVREVVNKARENNVFFTLGRVGWQWAFTLFAFLFGERILSIGQLPANVSPVG